MFLVIACGQSKHEVFLEGQKIEGDAERGACKLQYEPDVQAQVINTEIVSTCLAETEKAIALYEKAKSMGYDDADFQRVYDDHIATLPGVQRLRSTLVMKTLCENRPLPLG